MASKLVLRGTFCALRPWQPRDAPVLAAIADDPAVARYLTLLFPAPYRLHDAQAWIREHRSADPPLQFAVEADGVVAGGAGLLLGVNEHAGSAAIGYWLGTAFWGKGIATDALRTLTEYALATLGLRRVWANVMAPNVASARVLHKAGFVHEATLRHGLVDRAGNVHDELIFARLPAEVI